MKALPEALRQILRDLIEKKLWPVAVLLLAAIVVAPMLLGASSPDAADPVPVAAAPSAAPPVPAVAPSAAKTDAAIAKHDRRGKVEDPFYDPPAVPQASASVSAPAPGAGGAASAPTAGKTAPPAGGDAATPSEQAVAKPSAGSTREPAARARPSVYYRTVVSFGRPDEQASHPIARLTPLGGRDDPAALYLGVTRSEALWAIFALGPNTTSKGDATCKTGTGCRMIGLRRGDKQIVTVRDTDGRALRRFTLRVRSVRTITTSPARARTMRARVHSDGRAAIGALRQDPAGAAVLGQAVYRLRTGLLHATVPREAVKQATR
jgi:hypothetical protein